MEIYGSMKKSGNYTPINYFTLQNFKGINLNYEIDNVDTSNLTSLYRVFYYCSKLEGEIDISKWNCEKVEDISGMFDGCTKLEKIKLCDFKNIKDMRSLFSGCRNLINVDISNIKVIDNFSYNFVNYMFENCISIDDNSLDNFLLFFIRNANKFSIKKISSNVYTGIDKTRFQALPHYQEFINLGFSLG